MANAKYQKIEQLINSSFIIADKGVVKFLCASVLSHYLSGPPVWSFLVGPPSSGKTALLDGIANIKNNYSISSLTTKTFISGMKKHDQETSLLHIIKNGLLTLKDFTSILGMHQEEKKELFSQLREIFDGKINKRFGTGLAVNWEGKITLIAGVTEAIYQAHEVFSSMGERFAMYSLDLPDRYNVAYHTLGKNSDTVEMRQEIQLAFNAYFDEMLAQPINEYDIDEDLRVELSELSEFATRARSAVERDWRSPKKDITHVYRPEMPARFARQLKAMAQSLMIINENNKLENIDFQILHKMSLDSINFTRRAALRELARYDKVTTAGLATKIHYPTDTTRRLLEDLNALEVCERIKGSNKDEWQLKNSYKKIVLRLEHIIPVNKDLVGDEAEQYDALMAKANVDAPLPPLPELPKEIDPAELFNPLPEQPTA